jgi:hypothetical protein
MYLILIANKTKNKQTTFVPEICGWNITKKHPTQEFVKLINISK